MKEILGTPAADFKFGLYTPDMLPEHAGMTYELETNPGITFEDPFDIENLKFYDKGDARNLVNELEVINYKKAEQGGDEKIVAVVGTGGTIAMVKENGVQVPRLDAERLLGELPGGKRNKYEIASVLVPKMVDSSEMPADVIADTVLLMSATYAQMTPELKKNFAGFLVTHGTDTMADSASLFRMMLGKNVPFNTAFVGSQKTTEEDFNDVSVNLDGALGTLKYAHDDFSADVNDLYGATHHVVFMNGSSGAAMNQTGVIKVSDADIEAFASPIHDPILLYKRFGEDGIRRLEANQRRNNQGEFKPLIVRGYVNVETIRAEQSRDPRLDRAHLQAVTSICKLSGIVGVTYGSYTFHPANVGAIMEVAKAANVPVFMANQVASGSTDHEYGPAKEVRASGAEPVLMMPAATRAKIHVGRAIFGDSRDDFMDFMRTDYVGEMPEGYDKEKAAA